MKSRSTFVLLLLAVLTSIACSDTHHVIRPAPIVVDGDGIVVEETRPVPECVGVTLEGFGQLYIQQGSRTELTIRAESNLMEYLQAEVQGGNLVIWKDGATLVNTYPIEYHLTVADLQEAALTGAGGIHGNDIAAGHLSLRLTGVGSIEFVNLTAQSLDVEDSGVGDVTVSGAVAHQTIELKSFGNYDGAGLESDRADVQILNTGSATVRVRDSLNATINGSGSVYYIGNPSITTTITGPGTIVALGG